MIFDRTMMSSAEIIIYVKPMIILTHSNDLIKTFYNEHL